MPAIGKNKRSPPFYATWADLRHGVRRRHHVEDFRVLPSSYLLFLLEVRSRRS